MTYANKTIKNKQPKKPPSKAIKSIQHDLFSQFLTNNEDNVSNTIEYWERIPKYFISADKQKKLRTKEGLANPFSYEYIIKDHQGNQLSYKVKIQPALIEQKNKSYKAFFPTKVEETIEEVLKKIFTEQQYAIHDPKNTESWVKFSYGMIRKELKGKNCGRTYLEIKHSLEVMSKCVLTVYENGKEIYTGAILQDYCSVDREKYLDNTNALHVARFPIFISHAVNTLQYRQYNYLRFMECKEQLTRFIYKRLISRFIHANYLNDYHFLYSDIKQASGLLQQTRETDNRKKVISALSELKKQGALLSYEVKEKQEGRKITDVKYTVTASPDFISEQKAANKRKNSQRIVS